MSTSLPNDETPAATTGSVKRAAAGWTDSAARQRDELRHTQGGVSRFQHVCRTDTALRKSETVEE